MNNRKLKNILTTCALSAAMLLTTLSVVYAAVPQLIYGSPSRLTTNINTAPSRPRFRFASPSLISSAEQVNRAQATGPFESKTLRDLSFEPAPREAKLVRTRLPLRLMPMPLSKNVYDSSSYAMYGPSNQAHQELQRFPSPLASLAGPAIGSGTDVASASNGTQAISIGASTLYVYYFPNLEAQSSLKQLFCSGTGLGVCNTGAYVGDARVEYDPFQGRWIISALWPNGSNTAWNTIAVSKTSDAAGGYFVYQYLACNRVVNGIDQPRLGFNDRWLVVSTLCPAPNSDYGLTVFNKNALYAGNALQETVNLFKYIDRLNVSPIQRDQPTRTYTTPADDQEFLVEPIAVGSNGTQIAETVYSYLDGATNNPILHTATTTYSSNLYGNLIGLIKLDSPSCTACIVDNAYTNIHSATVNAAYPSGDAVIYSTSIYGNKNFANSTEVISQAVNIVTGGSASVGWSDSKAGGGIMASEIAVADVPSFNNNHAIIGYADTNNTTYPGTKDLEWNIDTNSITYVSYLALGNHTPNTSGDGARWIDYLDGACTVTNSASVFLSGSAAVAKFRRPGPHSLCWCRKYPLKKSSAGVLTGPQNVITVIGALQTLQQICSAPAFWVSKRKISIATYHEVNRA